MLFSIISPVIGDPYQSGGRLPHAFTPSRLLIVDPTMPSPRKFADGSASGTAWEKKSAKPSIQACTELLMTLAGPIPPGPVATQPLCVDGTHGKLLTCAWRK